VVYLSRKQEKDIANRPIHQPKRKIKGANAKKKKNPDHQNKYLKERDAGKSKKKK